MPFSGGGGGGGATTFIALTDVPATYVGAATQFVRVNAGETGLEFIAGSVAAHNILSATHTDTLAAAVVRGDILRGNVTPAWERFAIAAAAQYLRSNGTDPLWSVLLAADLSGVVGLANAGLAVSMVGLARGDVLRGNAGATAFERLALAAAAQYLRSNGTDPVWSALLAADISGAVAIANGGTAGTTAVLARSNLGIVMPLSYTAENLATIADSTTYFACQVGPPGTTDSFLLQAICPIAGTVTGFWFMANLGTAGTAGFTTTISLRVNGADPAGAPTVTQDWSVTNVGPTSDLVNTAVLAEGDRIGIKIVTPAWAPTNPANGRFRWGIKILSNV